MLTETARVHAGQRVLIHAAAGGVGHLAVQIAKGLGAHVLGTARADKHDLLRSLGVDEPIDYTTRDFTEAAHEVDVVVNLVSGPYIRRSAAVLGRGGCCSLSGRPATRPSWPRPHDGACAPADSSSGQTPVGWSG
jgi:NADPH:quinone reductase-like Zn-dependent oxidoreductase